MVNGSVENNNLLFASLGQNNGGANLTINGNYIVGADGGITSNGYLTIAANQITNNGVLVSAGDMSLQTGNLDNNLTGLLSSSNNMKITATGALNNYGTIQTDQGSMTINVTGDMLNKGGLIRTQSQQGDINITANSFTNTYTGTLTTLTDQEVYHKVYDTAINADGQEYAGMTNKEVVAADMDTDKWSSSNLSQYFYESNVKVLKVYAPEGMYTADGKPAYGYFYAFLSYGNNHNGPSISDTSRVEVTGIGTKTILENGSAGIVSAGNNLTIQTTGAITNTYSHIEARSDMTLTGSTLDNKSSVDTVDYSVSCFNTQLCRTLFPKDQSNIANPVFWFTGNPNSTGGSVHEIYNSIWGSNTTNYGTGSTIVAGGVLKGQFEGQVNNTTIINKASSSDFVNSNPSLPSGKNPTTTGGQSAQNGLNGPGNSTLSSDGSQVSVMNGKDNSLPGYSGVISPQGNDLRLHASLPGFGGSGLTSVNDILSSLAGGQSLFVPNPNLNGSGSSSGNVATVSTNAHGTINQGVVNTVSVNSNANYLIETRPQYTSVNEFYGSQYLLDRLPVNGSYMFLGDSGFDTNYIQQQYIQATGQSFTGGTYTNASDSMKALLDNAVSESNKLGLQFGTALTAEQQAALDEDIVWYVPQMVDGQTVLVPQLYLSPKTDVLAGAAIKGKDVSITAGSITNSGLMQGTNSISLIATNGDITNQGGTIKGGNIYLNAQNGSVINSNNVNSYLVNGGTSSSLGSQAQIIATGSLGIKASDSITTNGGTLQSGSDLAMQAGTINIGSTELNAAANSVTYASDGTLKFEGNQTKNYGTTIKAGGNASLQSTVGDLSFTGSNLSADGNVSLSSAGNVNLNTVTDSYYSDTKGHKSGTLTSSSFETKRAGTNEIGSNITSGGSLNILAKNDVNIAGQLSSTDDMNILAGGNVTSTGLKTTDSSYDYHKQSGLAGGIKGGILSVGYGKSKQTNTSDSTQWTASQISSDKGSILINAGKDVNLTATGLNAGKDVGVNGSSVTFGSLENTTHDANKSSSSFIGAGLVVVPNYLPPTAIGNFSSKKSNSGSDTLTHTSSVIQAGGDVTVVARDKDINLSGTSILSDGSTSLLAKNDVNLGTVTNSSSSYSNKKTANLFKQEKETSIPTQTQEIGSLVAAGKDVTIQAGHDVNIAGTVTGKNDVTLMAGNNISTIATKDTTSDYYHKSSSGLGASFNGGMASVGYQSDKRTDTSHSVTWTPSEVSAGHDLSITSGGSSTFTGTNLSAGNDLAISGSSVTFNTVQNTNNETHKSSSIFAGIKGGLGSDSVLGSVAQSAQAAADMSGSGSAAGKTLNAMQGGYQIGKWLGDHASTLGNINSISDLASTKLISVVGQYGFNISKSKSEASQSTVVGSSATAGNDLTIIARGDNPNDTLNGDLTATAAQLSGKNVTLSGNNVTLQSGWNTTSQHSKGNSFGGALGVEFGANAKGGSGLSIAANAQGSSQHANGNSATSVDTTVSATNNVTITAPGKTTLNGAQVSGNHITVDTGNLDIISPQDSSYYNSKTTQAGLQVEVPTPAGGDFNIGGSYGNQHIKDNYKTTGNTLSGLYAGDGGLNVHVSDTTHLTAGVISSTADASQNHFETGKLIADSLTNQSKWNATYTGGGFSFGADSLGSSLGALGLIGSNLAANSGMIAGGQRKHNETTTSQSVITGNISVNAGSVQGQYTTDLANANGHLDNEFNAEKLSNQLKNSQTGMQLVGEVMGQVSDALYDNHIPGFDETNLTNDWGRIILEAAGSAAVAGVTGGNVGSATASSVGGNLAVSSMGQFIADNAKAMAGSDPKLAEALTNLGANLTANGAGAAIGAAINGGSGAMNGAAIASLIQEYNWTFSGIAKILLSRSGNIALEVIERAPSAVVQGAGKGAATGAVAGGVAGSLAGGVGAAPGAAAGAFDGAIIGGVKGGAWEIGSILAGAVSDAVNTDNANEQAAQNSGQQQNGNTNTNVNASGGGGSNSSGDGGDNNKNNDDKKNNSDDKKTPIWSSGKPNDPVENAYEHWSKHKSDFPELQNSKQYVDAVKDFIDNPPENTMTKVRANGDTLYYNQESNTFAVRGANGAPKTMFKPENGIEYWNGQK